jgi:hypothetical protein
VNRRHAAHAAAWILVAACSGLTSSASTPVAIEFVEPPDTVAVGDTVPLHIRVLNRDGDSIPGAPVLLFSLDPDTLGVDSARLAVVGVAPGPGRVVARSGELSSNPFRIIVTAP